MGEPEHRPRLTRASLAPLLLVPVRLGLAGGGLAAATVVGVRAPAAHLAFVMGTFLTAFLLSSDRRFLLYEQRDELLPVPADASFAGPWETVARGMIPSTLGVAALGAAALGFSTVLTALLAGVEAGMGLVGLISGIRLAAWERRLDGRLYVVPGRRGFYVAGRARLTAPG